MNHKHNSAVSLLITPLTFSFLKHWLHLSSLCSLFPDRFLGFYLIRIQLWSFTYFPKKYTHFKWPTLSYWAWAFPCSQWEKLWVLEQANLTSTLLGGWLPPVFSFCLLFFKIETNLSTASAVPFFLPDSLIRTVKPFLDFTIFCKYH